MCYNYRGLTFSAALSQHASSSTTIYHSPTRQQPDQNGPTTPPLQRLSAITQKRFGLIRVRSPLLTESLLFSLPRGTEMFHFPPFPRTGLYIQPGVAGHYSGSLRGFPIRTSPDHSSCTNSPGLIADYHVLHRLLVPRHPPIALSSLSNKKPQNKTKLQRCSRPLSSSQTTHEPQPPHQHKAGMKPGPHKETTHTHTHQTLPNRRAQCL